MLNNYIYDQNNKNTEESKNTHILSRAMLFEKVVGKILSEEYYINSQHECKKTKFNFVTSNNINIEVKYSNQNSLLNFVTSIRNYLSHNSIVDLDHTIFVTNLLNEDSLPNTIIRPDGRVIYVITLENLLYLCRDNASLRSELTMCLHFSTENVIPCKFDSNIDKLLQGCKKEQTVKNKKDKFEMQLKQIQLGHEGFTEYENFCTEFIKTVFQDNIENPITQKVNNYGLYRFDLVASLKDNPASFWKFIYDKFNSCFILFECKNYKDEIGQNEIYTTERYLYNNALRNVAIILTRKGMDKNAEIACQGILKEHGKLILVLNDSDIKKLEIIYTNRKTDKNLPSPSDFLYDKAKEFLLNLDK